MKETQKDARDLLDSSADGKIKVDENSTVTVMLAKVVELLEQLDWKLWEIYSFQQKMDILNIFIEIKDNNEKFVDYFENYSNYLSKITLNSFTKSVLDHKF